MALVDPPFCTTDDVAGIWRSLQPEELDRVNNLIDDASAMILEYPAVVDRIAAGLLTADTLISITKHMVRRVLLNPSGLRQFSTTVDDATKSGTYDSSVASGQLYITEAEMGRLLGNMTSSARSGAFTIVPFGAPDELAVPWASWI